MRLCDGISALLLKSLSCFIAATLSRRAESHAGRLGERVGIWDQDYRSITNHKRCPLPRGAAAFLRVDLGRCCRTEAGPVPGPDFNALLLRETPRQLRLAFSWIKSGVCNTLLVSLPELKFVFTPHLELLNVE